MDNNLTQKTQSQSSQQRNTNSIQIQQKNSTTNPSILKKCSNLCCFPGFWLLIVILALVFGLFFVLVAKSKIGDVDWRLVNNMTKQATQPPKDSKAILNQTDFHREVLNKQGLRHQLGRIQEYKKHDNKYGHKLEKMGIKNHKSSGIRHQVARHERWVMRGQNDQ